MAKRECSKCHIKKSDDKFNWRDKKKKILQCRCKECTQEASREHYKNNSTHRTKVNEARRKRIAENREKILEYFRNNSCVDCGETHPAALEFDHVRGKKEGNVSNMMYRYNWDRVIQEITKCEVRCANCHNKKTAKQYGYFTAVF